MSDLPCLNPHCKSHGKPHPNCRCYGYDEGGDVGFCNSGMAHEKGCEYYAAGGPVKNVSSAVDILNPSEESRWASGKEDKGESVASALFHSGAKHLLMGSLRGAYADPDSGMQAASNKKLSNKAHKLSQEGFSIDQIAKKISSSIPNRLAEPLLKRMISNGEVRGLNNLISYTNNVKQGSKKIESAIEALMVGEKIDDDGHSKEDNDKLDEYIKNGEFQKQLDPRPQMLAGGGEVSPNVPASPMELVLPEHNMLINSAKARINNYLSSIRPAKNLQMLPFDKEPKDVDKHKDYQNALSLANNPIGILSHIKNGSITPGHVQHFTNMYPEVHEHISKKMNERIVHARLNDETPKYHIRQGMSAFLGEPLDSTLTQPAIEAAQMTYSGGSAQAPQQAPQKGKPKKDSSKLSKLSDQYRTPLESSEAREQKG